MGNIITMLQFIKNNPWKSMTGVVTLLTALSTAGYGVYSTSSNYFKQFATKSYVKEQINDLNLEVLNVAIMRYEDELMSIEFLIETDAAKPMDKVTKKNIERRLQDLKAKRVRLEETSAYEDSN